MVEPARGRQGQWEMCVDYESNEWLPVGCGNYPAVSFDAARAAALALLKNDFYPKALREADAQLQKWIKRVADLTNRRSGSNN